MNRIVKMAWRNIWRNKRRTLITIASIFFAIFFAIIMRSFQLGTYANMIKQSIEMFTGYLQVQDPEYFDDPNLDNSLAFNQELIKKIKNTPGVKIAAPRIESFVLAANGTQSKGILVTGIDPDKEVKISNPEHLLVHYQLTPEIVKSFTKTFNPPKKLVELLKMHENGAYNNLDRLALDLAIKPAEMDKFRVFFKEKSFVEGSYLSEKDDGVLVSEKLAKFLNVVVGDTLTLLGQGYHGNSAAGLFPVRGIVRIPAPDLNNKLIYMTIPTAQEFFSLGDRITAVVINLVNTDEMEEVQTALENQLNSGSYTVKNWKDINKTLKQQIDGDNKSGQMFIGVLYFIIFFGIFGTVIMMINERKREFGVLVAIGMRKKKLALVVLMEMFFIGLVGTISGMLASVPLILTFHQNPIRFTGESAKIYEDMGFDPVMPTATIGHYFSWQAIIILIMVIAACYFPLQRIRKMKIMNALRA